MNAKIALWEDCVALFFDADLYEAILVHTVHGAADVELVVIDKRIIVGITPRPLASTTIHANLSSSIFPWRIRVKAKQFQEEVGEALKRFGSLAFELSGGKGGFSGEIDLAPHLRPWPKLRPCKAYDISQRSVEIYKERIMSTILAGDQWTSPPKDFIEKCPKSFMTIWGEMPEGLALRMPDGYVHRR